ncbi:hypothetical protein, partial [Cylindrospermopsis sp. CR12]|uniref:hypothetical protein n=1 Tax=Cylindrospermopsis sp. CR12 TaxID=1747196 RepID=UPI001F219225
HTGDCEARPTGDRISISMSDLALHTPGEIPCRDSPPGSSQGNPSGAKDNIDSPNNYLSSR